MRVIVMVCHGFPRRHTGRRCFFKAPSRGQMTMGSTRFQQTGVGHARNQGEYPNKQHQESGVAFRKGA